MILSTIVKKNNRHTIANDGKILSSSVVITTRKGVINKTMGERTNVTMFVIGKDLVELAGFLVNDHIDVDCEFDKKYLKIFRVSDNGFILHNAVKLKTTDKKVSLCFRITQYPGIPRPIKK